MKALSIDSIVYNEPGEPIGGRRITQGCVDYQFA